MSMPNWPTIPAQTSDHTEPVRTDISSYAQPPKPDSHPLQALNRRMVAKITADQAEPAVDRRILRYGELQALIARILHQLFPASLVLPTDGEVLRRGDQLYAAWEIGAVAGKQGHIRTTASWAPGDDNLRMYLTATGDIALVSGWQQVSIATPSHWDADELSLVLSLLKTFQMRRFPKQ